MTKEEVYDEQIEPLMKQITRICRDRGIAMVASFHVSSFIDPHSENYATTVLLSDRAPDSLVKARVALKGY